MERTYLGIEIGGSKLQMALGDEVGKVIESARWAVDREAGGEGIREQIESKLPEFLGPRILGGVGVGFGGPVCWQTGKVARSHQIEGWADFNLCRWVHSFTEVPVHVENDANIAALAEARHGAGKGGNPAFYVTLGSGVGGGLVVDDHVYHGAPPGESEIGHIRLDRSGATVESRCSGWAMDARIRSAVAAEPGCLLGKMIENNKGCEARYLRSALDLNDPIANRVLGELADDLAVALSHVVHLFHPEVIVLGGGLSLMGEPLCTAVAVALQQHLMEILRPGPQLALASLGEDSVPIGALELARGLR